MRHRGWSALFIGLLLRSTAEAQVQGACDAPVSARLGPTGCYVLDSLPIRAAAPPLYWYIFQADSGSTPIPDTRLLHAHHRFWLVAIDGEHLTMPVPLVARVGPLPMPEGSHHLVARFMESTLTGGTETRVHTHPGPEAWYLLSGAQCLETPTGTNRVAAHSSLVLAGGQPMRLTATGPDTMRSLVLVLHDGALPWIDRTTTWSPAGSCSR